ncbi:hypothetical protein BV22DRAFT_1010124 [Leucogyrophana mollusca]|uniref:Uncharacterized protein n=1 Tax=Leucogyrophana mollusca TaxID=85980 RepID=A0ACB8BK82_9AGAM|nr:hypothetical protein BV22DRAFT_1010124 [Leucogyrophana mollusca]
MSPSAPHSPSVVDPDEEGYHGDVDVDGEEAAFRARTKRRISALENELEDARSTSKKQRNEEASVVNRGRVIRRLVSMFDSVGDMVAENDRRADMLDTDEDLVTEPTRDEDRLYSSFKELLVCLPWLRRRLLSDSPDELETLYKQLRKGADGARGDDTSNLKQAVVTWLTASFHPLTPPIRPAGKEGRGFAHDVTGKLLCPAEYQWSLAATKNKIRDRDPDFLVTAHSWPMFLYRDYTYDATDIESGLLQSALMVKAYKHLFTSPSSARDVEGDGDGADMIVSTGRRSDQATRKHLRFALSNARSWRSYDGDFDYPDFYNNIVDFFEIAPNAAAATRVKELLRWWNRKVFGRDRPMTLTDEMVGNFSVGRMAAQRSARDGVSP